MHASVYKAYLRRRILHIPNAIQTTHDEKTYLIIYYLNCVRYMKNPTFETGLNLSQIHCGVLSHIFPFLTFKPNIRAMESTKINWFMALYLVSTLQKTWSIFRPVYKHVNFAKKEGLLRLLS